MGNEFLFGFFIACFILVGIPIFALGIHKLNEIIKEFMNG